MGVSLIGGDRYDPERTRTMPPCPLGRCVNVTHASGALQFFASSTAAFEVPGSRVGRAALMSAGTGPSIVDFLPKKGGFPRAMFCKNTPPAISADARPPTIPITTPPQETGLLP